jgi:hypothetical protein
MDEKIQHQSADDKPDLNQLEDLKKSVTVDTLHNDEGMRVLANYTGDLDWTKDEEKRLVR